MPIMSSLGALTYNKRSNSEWYIGRFVEGGYYIGDYNGYRLILSPKSSQSSSSLKLQISVSSTGINSKIDGLTNTNSWVALGAANTPAADYCYNLTTNGYTDWFLPAKNQLNFIYTALPVLVNLNQQPYNSTSLIYLWTSSEATSSEGSPTFDAWIQYFKYPTQPGTQGDQSLTRKDFGLGVQPAVRAMRQVPI